MNKIILFLTAFCLAGAVSAQNLNTATKIKLSQTTQKNKTLPISHAGKTTSTVAALNNGSTIKIANGGPADTTLLPLSPNGKLLSVDGMEVEFKVPENPEISNVCYTPRPYVEGTSPNKSAGCPFTVPCDNPANRDAANTATTKYFQLVWHVMMDGGPTSNIDQTRIDQLMTELNADYATHNAIFCAIPATFYEDAANYWHNSATEEWQLKDLYNVTPTEVINIYVVGDMTAGGYARFPYDPNGGTNAHGGIVLNRGNCNVGTHTLAHEMGHVFGLEHTFSGVDERTECSACYEQVRNANGSSNASGVPTPFLGPYNSEGDQEGDWCSDTNPHDTYAYNCSTSSNTNGVCDVGPWANAPVNNHMSYSFCSSQFTNQQSRRMHCMVDTYLGTWTAYGGGICGTLPPVADFVGTPQTWQAPSNVTFTDLSTPQAIITGWTWTFDVGASGTVTCAGCVGASAVFVGQVPPVVTYANPGLYTVSLDITSANGPDNETKVDYIQVLAPSGDCDTLTFQWETPTSTIVTYGFGGGYITGVPDPTNSTLPTDPKGVYEGYFSPNPGTTPVGAVRVGMGSLRDDDDDMTFQITVYDDDGFGAPGALVGGTGGLSPTALGVPGAGFYNEFWVPLLTPAIPTTAFFHVGVEFFPSGDATDTCIVMTSCLGPGGCAVAQGENDASNTIWTSGFGYENLLTVYGADFDVDIIPMLGEWAPSPRVTGFAENVICDTTFVTVFDTTLYAIPTGMTFTFASGPSFSYGSDPLTHNLVYTTPGPDTLMITAVNDCGRADTTYWLIPYNFLSTPDAEFSASPVNPVCLGAPGVTFTADVAGYIDYTWDFGDGTGTVSTAGVNSANHIYAAPGLYYVELTATEAGFLPADTMYLEDFESGWPAGYLRFNNDVWTPDPAVNPPFDGTDGTAWLDLDADGNGDTEAVSTSWNGGAGQLADDWMITTGIGILPANQRLFWNAEASDVNFSDGYEVRISTVQLPATVANYSTVLFSVGAENAFNTTRSVDLSAYAGQTVYIAFRNNSDWMNLLYIDDIRVGTASPGCSASILKTDFIEVIDCGVIPPTAVLNTSTTTGCSPLTVTFTDATVAGDPATTWLWNFGDATFSTLQNPPAHIYATPGTYFVSFEACNSGGCTTDFTTIVVTPPPSIDLTTPTDPTCAGNDGQIVITASGGAPAILYSNDNGVTFQASNTFTGLADATYNIVVEDAVGCQDVAVVVLSPAPTPNLIITDPAAVCSPATVNITLAAVTAGSDPGVLSYWTDAGATVPLIGPTTVSVGGTYYIQLNNAGCTTVMPVVVTIDPQPNLVVTNPAAVCAPGTVDITAGAVTAGSDAGALTYWTDAGATIPLVGPATVGVTGTYYIQLNNGTCTIVQPVNVVINSLPNLVITDPAGVCTPGTVNITAGAVTVGSSAGTLSYWTDLAATIPLVGPAAVGITGTYYIQLVNGNGCSVVQPVNVLINPLPNLVITDPPAACSSGTVDLTAAAVTAGSDAGALTYWTNAGATTPLGGPAMVASTGTYYIKLDNGTCSVVQAVNVVINPLPTLVITDPAAVCTPGTVDLTAGAVTAGSDAGALTYWTDLAATIPLVGPATVGITGTYYIQLVDGNGCSVVQAVNVVINPLPNLVITDPAAACTPSTVDITAGAVTAGSDAGTLTYWTDAGATIPLVGPAAVGITGTYYIQLVNGNGCSIVQPVNVVINPVPTFIISGFTDPSACGLSDGTYTISGLTPLTAYSLAYLDDGTPIGPTPIITDVAGDYVVNGLNAGSYTNITISDGTCGFIAGPVTITDPAAPAFTLAFTDPTTCGGADGTITIQGLDPLTAYALTYTDDAIPNGPAPIVTDAAGAYLISGLNAGSYTNFIVDLLGCIGSNPGPVTLSDPAAPNLVISDPAAVCSPGTVDVTAGAVTAGSDAGTLTYWTDAGATIALVGPATVGVTGTYYIQLDAAGCVSIQPVNVVVNPLPNLVITDPAVICAPGTVNITAAAVTAGSDAGTLSYWTDAGATTPLVGPAAVATTGMYYIELVDGNGCSVIQPVNVVVNPLPNLVITDPAAICSPGTVDITVPAVTVGSDAGALSYWSNVGATLPLGGPATVATTGMYYIQLIDGNGCSSIQPVNVVVNPLPNLVITDPTGVCLPGAADITAGTVTAGSDAGTLTYWMDAGATVSLVGPAAITVTGTYYIELVDGNGCSVIQPVNVVVNPLPNLIITDPATVCDLNTVNLTSAAVTAGSDAGTLSYWTDAGATIPLVGPAAVAVSGMYYIQLIDGNGCSVIQPVNVTISSPIISNVASTDPTCGTLNGDITITASGGTGALLYSIDNGITFQAGNNFPGLGAATYILIVEDAIGCQASSSVVLSDVGGPTITMVSTTDPACGNVNGTINISATGGAGALQYSIDNGVVFQPGNSFNGLGANSYTCIVEDANGCTSAASVVVLTASPSPVITIDNIVDVVCFGDLNGAVDVTITSGLAPYLFDWSFDGTGDTDDPEDVVNSPAGVFTLTVIDANGCTAFVTDVINGPSQILLSAVANDETLGSDGTINLSVSGGVAPFTYDWDNDGVGDNDDTQDLTGLTGNTTYQVIVTDANGCVDTLDVFVGSVVGLDHLINDMGVSVYPNPTTGEFYVSFASFDGDVTIDITDVAGKLIYQSYEVVSVNGIINLEINEAAAGMYFVNVKSENDVYSTRLMKK